MGFAEDKFYQYLRKNLVVLESIRVDELLIPLSGCLSLATVEKLNAFVRNQGNRKSVLDFYLDLSRSDDWVTHFIDALRHCDHMKLAQQFEEVYSSYQRPNSTRSSPRSLPSSVNNRQPPRENPKCSPSLPGQRSPTNQNAQPSPSLEASQRFNQIQPEQQMIQHSPSHPNPEFRSLPPLPRDSPDPPRTPLSNNPSAPIHSDRSTIEDESVRNPVPETTPYQSTPSEGNVEVPETRPTPSSSPSTSSDGGSDNWRSQSVHDKKPLEEDPIYKAADSGQTDHGGKEQRETSIIHKVDNIPDRSPARYRPVNPETAEQEPNREWTPNQRVNNVSDRSPASYRPGFRGTAQEEPNREWTPKQVNNVPDRSPASYRPENQEAAQEEPNRERTPKQVNNVPDRSPASYHPVFRGTAQEEPNREWTPNQQVPSGSSCRPLGNNDDDDDDDDDEEEDIEKPGVLMSTPDFVGAINLRGASSELSHVPVLEISDCTERSESSNASGQSSTPVTQNRAPPVATPEERSMQIKDRRSPEENDFTFYSKSTPGSNIRLNESSPKQPEENSFDSRDVGHFRLQYDDSPEGDLMETNDGAVRNRLRKTPEPNDQKYSKKAEGRDYERRALITITVASLCLSLYLLWKIRNK